ncbi:uncharacterized protein KRP23_13291 [Phytophthora ramorum]|uniref:uncharacterized protein n=1 Tax=Phytophthora ramorum TaxID=164328 RepID=UPI0030954D35|nr:hypothetical protein KRP23_13291 [Phytophthora ramorum]
MDADSTAGGDVFQLYQQGLTPDHVLQLCYLRRRSPRLLRPERTRIEDEFVLPRPELKIASLLPAIDIPLQQLLAAPRVENASGCVAAGLLTGTTLAHAKESVRKHFLEPRQAAVEDVCQWSALAKCDWLQIHRSLQRPKKQQGQDDGTTGIDAAAPLPDIADVCWLLEQCPSDAFASFVWDHLLISLLQQCSDHNTSHKSTHQHLLSLLTTQHSFFSLSPKDFRAKVRSRNLRQVDDTFGAQAELALIAFYRKQRNDAK